MPFNNCQKFRVLCATKQGEHGVENINEQIKNILARNGLISISQNLYMAQPIMITENNYKQGLYNGDIGLIWKNESGHLMAVFEDASLAQKTTEKNKESNYYKWIIPSRLPKFETVYAMTIHKTQGSEFEHVAMVLPKEKNNRLLSRELLYTGITRAKLQLSISSNETLWKQSVKTQIKLFL